MSTNRALWDRELSRVVQYPRGDDQDVVQLNMERYLPLTIVRETAPEPVDGFQAVAVRSVDLEAAEWRWGWELVAIPPPPPPGPDWGIFKREVMSHPQVNLVLGGGLGQVPAAAIALPATVIASAAGGDVDDFRAAWLALRRVGLVSAELLAEVRTLAIGCNLPEPFVAALGGATRPAAEFIGQEWIAPDGALWRVVQARGDDGQFLPDDPGTTERESLEWVEVTT
jgi:hypothetical protein